jgi:crotonobetainyl-CoA:carnitine CoA-transferase CaiB-like acyl-CoA transferase
MTQPQRPLSGIRVLELGQLLAGPFASCMLAYFGAEVIKIEPRTGDPLRSWRVLRNGTSLWWYSLARNKKSVTIELHTEAGQELVRQLSTHCDVVLENFRPGTMEKWRLGPEDLKAGRPDLIYARVSGYGQNGPYAHKPGFASVAEAIGGLRYLNGFADRPSVRPNLSLGDTLAGMHTVIGILLALMSRQRSHAGQVVDVAIYESVFNMLEAVVPEYDETGVVRGPSGSTVTGIVPSNTYLCRDGRYVVIGANGDSLFQRLMHALHRPDLANDPRLASNAGRVQHEAEIDAVIASWTGSHDCDEVVALLDTVAVPSGPIYSVAEMTQDPHFVARGLFERVEVDGAPLTIPAILPRLAQTPGYTQWPGPKLGEHTDEVLSTLLNLSSAQVAGLRAQGVI